MRSLRLINGKYTVVHRMHLHLLFCVAQQFAGSRFNAVYTL